MCLIGAEFQILKDVIRGFDGESPVISPSDPLYDSGVSIAFSSQAGSCSLYNDTILTYVARVAEAASAMATSKCG